MPFRKEFEYPSDEELTIPEVNISYSYLLAGSLHFAKYCEKENNEFMLCKQETDDPRKCLKEGRDVTNCALKFFCNIKKHCRQEFDQFAFCVNRARHQKFEECRNTEAIFDKCVLDKLGQEKPPFGWQAETHIHHSERPQPEKKIIYYPDAADKLPADFK